MIYDGPKERLSHRNRERASEQASERYAHLITALEMWLEISSRRQKKKLRECRSTRQNFIVPEYNTFTITRIQVHGEVCKGFGSD